MKILYVISAILVSSVLNLSAYADECKNLKGDIVVNWDFENCQSPMGVCTKGEVLRSAYHADTRYVVQAFGGSVADDPSILTYSGSLTLTFHDGTVVIDDIGIFDQGTGNISSQSRQIHGTGRYENVTGSFFTTGLATGPGFDSEISGFFCY